MKKKLIIIPLTYNTFKRDIRRDSIKLPATVKLYPWGSQSSGITKKLVPDNSIIIIIMSSKDLYGIEHQAKRAHREVYAKWNDQIHSKF